MENNLLPCPFCGGDIRLVSVCQTPQERKVHMRCSCCWMEFIHSQTFAIGLGGTRVAYGQRFEETWNGRADHDQA